MGKKEKKKETTKVCPACKSEILVEATRCPHCQKDLRSWFRKHPILTIIIVLFVIGLVSSSNGNKTGTSNSTNLKSEDKKVQPREDPNPHFKDGTFEVGKDVQAGTYRTRVGSSNCYYSRLSGFGGSLGEIISNENTDYPAVVTIASTDSGFKSTRCGVWTQDLSQITKSKTIFDDGIYIIGTDIEPGKYKNVGQDGCYYSRLKGFSGSLGDIISNENTDDPAIVTIAATDKGFKSSRCGTWTKI